MYLRAGLRCLAVKVLVIEVEFRSQQVCVLTGKVVQLFQSGCVRIHDSCNLHAIVVIEDWFIPCRTFDVHFHQACKGVLYPLASDR